jgi:molecular chaperone Hsp33
MISDNFIQTFQLANSSIRGRIVSLGAVLDDILTAHAYPEPVSHLTAETITLCALLSAMLKYEGIFILQARGDGPVNTVVSDVTSQGIIRGCSSYKKGIHVGKGASPIGYLGKGHLAFTVDQGKHTDRYQGIVALKGDTLTKCVQHYFAQSEQISTSIKLTIGKFEGKWRSGAIMLQHMPEDNNESAGKDNAHEDNWRRAMALQESCSEEELLSHKLDSNDLLFHLFHEDGVRVYERKELLWGCRCNSERVENIIFGMSSEDIEHMSNNNKIEMKCEFCSKTYTYEKDYFLRRPSNR